jgi:hypothetical protein
MASGVALFLNARGALPPASTELCSSAAGPFKSCIQIGEEPIFIDDPSNPLP